MAESSIDALKLRINQTVAFADGTVRSPKINAFYLPNGHRYTQCNPSFSLRFDGLHTTRMILSIRRKEELFAIVIRREGKCRDSIRSYKS